MNEFSMSAEHFHIVFAPRNLANSLAAFPTQLTFGDGTFTTLGGQDASYPGILALMDYHFSDTYSKTKGSHSLKAGYDFSRYDMGNSYYTNANGLLVPSTVDAFFYGGIDQASVAAGGRDYTTLTKAYVSNGFQPIAQFHMGAFIQDEWKARNTLTFTLALRLDHSSNPTCQHNCFARTTLPFDELDHNPSIPYNQVIQTGLHESLYNLQYLEWQPRFGFSWQPFGISGRTVVRGGAGFFYDNVPINIGFNFAANPPLVNTFTASRGNLAPAETNSLFAQTAQGNSAFLSGFAQGFTLADFERTVPNFVPPGLQGAADAMAEPLVTKWNLEIERRLWRNGALTVGYVGNHTIHGWIQNGSVNAYASNFAGLPAVAPDPRFGPVTIMQDIAVSNYNGANVSLLNNFGRDSIVQVNYTYSHALTDAIGTFNPRFIEDPYDRNDPTEMPTSTCGTHSRPTMSGPYRFHATFTARRRYSKAGNSPKLSTYIRGSLSRSTIVLPIVLLPVRTTHRARRGRHMGYSLTSWAGRSVPVQAQPRRA